MASQVCLSTDAFGNACRVQPHPRRSDSATFLIGLLLLVLAAFVLVPAAAWWLNRCRPNARSDEPSEGYRAAATKPTEEDELRSSVTHLRETLDQQELAIKELQRSAGKAGTTSGANTATEGSALLSALSKFEQPEPSAVPRIKRRW